jgi:hypothetical protein
MRFMILMIPKGYENAQPKDLKPDPRSVTAMLEYSEALKKAGVLLSSDGLYPPSMGARITFADGKPNVIPGPFPDVHDVIGGYFMINVSSKEEAIAWASRCPPSEHEIIEVRQVQEEDEFIEDVPGPMNGFSEMQV